MQAMEGALFGGIGYVPNVPSLQILLERAWALGWDRCPSLCTMCSMTVLS